MTGFFLERNAGENGYDHYLAAMLPRMTPPKALGREFDLSETLREASPAPPTAATVLLPDLAASQLHDEAIQALGRLELDFAEDRLREALALALPQSRQGKLLTVGLLITLAQVMLLKGDPFGAYDRFVRIYAAACELRRPDLLQIGARGKSVCDQLKIRTAESAM